MAGHPFRQIISSYLDIALLAVAIGCGALLLASCSREAADAPVAENVAVPAPAEARWSELYGGTSADQFRDVAMDLQGNSVLVGGSASSTYPTTPGTAQPVHSPGAGSPGILNMDVIVTKVDPSGRTLWSTFLGGNGYDRAYAVEVDHLGFILVAGRAGAGFPTTPGTLQPTFGGGPGAAPYGPEDGFVCKLTSAGQKVWCTYFGKDELNIIRDIDVDPVGNIYLATSTQRDDWPASWFANRFQTKRKGGCDDMLVKLSSDGTRVLWATYIGSSKDETRTVSVRTSSTATWFLTATDGVDLPTTSGRRPAGGTDFWVGGFSLDGRQLLHSSYVGGTGPEGIETHNLAVDGDRVYIAGQTGSSTFPNTSTASFWSGQLDGIVVALDTTARVIFSRYIGTPGADGLEGVQASPADVCVTGFMSGRLPGIPLWGTGGGRDAAMVCLSRNATVLTHGITVGGTGDDYARSLARTSMSIVGAGHSGSINWPLLSGGVPYGGGGDGSALRMQY
ncbi:MAG TPA: hypothetical protein VFU03_08650 [Gemmatimonadales bacterium]|nr:hypothetical protein [Gemmatimonadales bacterium]